VFDKSWRCVQRVQGRYTLAFFDFVEDARSPTGAYLYITNARHTFTCRTLFME